MAFRPSNKFERHEYHDQNSVNFTRPKPNNYPYPKSPLQIFDQYFQDLNNLRPQTQKNHLVTSNYSNYLPKYVLNNNPYVSKGSKIIEYSSSSSESNEDQESDNNLSDCFLKENLHAEEPLKQIQRTNSSQSIPSIHISDDSSFKKYNELNIFQKAFIVGLEKLQNKNNECHLSPIHPKDKPQATFNKKQEENYNKKQEENFNKNQEENYYKRQDENYNKKQEENFKKQEDNYTKNNLKENFKKNYEESKLESMIPFENKGQMAKIVLMKSQKNIFNSPICKNHGEIEGDSNEKQEENYNKNKKREEIFHQRQEEINLEPILPFDFRSQIEKIPLMKTNKNIFNSPIRSNNITIEKNSNEKQNLTDKNTKNVKFDENYQEKKVKISQEYKDNLILTPLIPLELNRLSSKTNKNMTTTPICLKKLITNENSNKKQSSDIKIFDNVFKTNIISLKNEMNSIKLKENLVYSNQKLEKTEENVYGFIVADRISLIEKKKIVKKNESFERNYTVDSDTICKELIKNNPYLPMNSGLLSPLQKI